MRAWFKRFGLHLAAAVGATGIFVAAAAVGASQVRQQTPPARPAQLTAIANRTPGAQRKPTVEVTTRPAGDAPTAARPQSPAPSATPRPTRVVPERSLAGTVQAVQGDELDVIGPLGREWHVVAVPGALIRLNGRSARLDTFEPGDSVVILGQNQANQGPGNHFLAQAITAHRK